MLGISGRVRLRGWLCVMKLACWPAAHLAGSESAPQVKGAGNGRRARPPVRLPANPPWAGPRGSGGLISESAAERDGNPRPRLILLLRVFNGSLIQFRPIPLVLRQCSLEFALLTGWAAGHCGRTAGRSKEAAEGRETPAVASSVPETSQRLGSVRPDEVPGATGFQTWPRNPLEAVNHADAGIAGAPVNQPPTVPTSVGLRPGGQGLLALSSS